MKEMKEGKLVKGDEGRVRKRDGLGVEKGGKKERTKGR